LFNSPDGVPANFQETELYRACLESGIIPRKEEDLGAYEPQADSRNPESFLPPLNLTMKVEGMWCPACSWLIEEVLRKTTGILESKVLFLSDLAQVKYYPHLLRPQEILDRISRLGYRPSLLQEASKSSQEKKGLLLRLGISSILTANIMMISYALYYGFFQELSRSAVAYLSLPLWGMATPVIFYGGGPILRRGFHGIRYGQTSMETLISIGALSAYLYSIFQMFRGSIHLYFDTAAMLIALVLLGKYLETHAREKVSKGMTDLYQLANQKVRLFTPTPTLPRIFSPPLAGGGLPWGVSSATPKGEGEGGRERWISARDAKPGDEFLVLAGERVPLDGRIITGQGNVDESILTGEPRPIKKRPGEEVRGGILLLDGKLTLRTTRVGEDSSLGQMITLMQETLSKKNPAELLADRITRWFVPLILILAAITAFYVWSVNFSIDEALLRSLTVLVISCPCALGIATPIVKVAAMGLGRSRGILIRDPRALERVKDLDTLVFDKTGTLTEGNFLLQEIITEGASEQEALGRLASVEAYSDHFLAQEIIRRAREKSVKMEEATAFEEFEGMGVKGFVGGREVFIGNRQLMNKFGVDLSSSLEKRAFSLESRGMTVVLCGWDQQVRGFLVFGDSIKRGVPELVKKLQARKIITWVVSGDAQETTRAVAEELGINQFRGQALPQDKVELIKSLQQKGHRVGMVGDGINDAAALARADVGFALGTGINITQEASDFTLLASDPTRVLEIFDLSALTMKTIRQNLFFAFLYNGLAIPLAVAGFLNPLIAVFAMFASSLTVIGNALRISTKSSRKPGSAIYSFDPDQL
jgi:heavy metal translocating P-type ATPase